MRTGREQLCAAQLLHEAETVIVGDLCRDDTGQFVNCAGGDAAGSGDHGATSATLTHTAEPLTEKLAAKIARQVPGRGGPVALSAAEIETIVAHGTFGIIGCGANPRLPEEVAGWTPAQEQARRDAIHADLTAKGYRFTDGRGKYDAEEASILVMVPNAEPRDLDEIGEKHHQDSVVYADRGKNQLRYTTGEKKGKRHEGVGYDRLSTDAENFFSEFAGYDQKKFVFALHLDFEKLVERFRRRYGLLYEAHYHRHATLLGGADAERRDVV